MKSVLAPRALPLLGAAAALSALLSGCSIPIDSLGGGTSPRPAVPQAQDGSDAQNGSDAQDGSSIDIFELKVGDCKLADDIEAEQLSETNIVPCDTAHDEEVYHEFELPQGDYPDEDTIDALAYTGCGAKFPAFVGTAADDSALDFAYYWPTEDGWEQMDDRLIQCVLFSKDGAQLKRSMKNAGV